MKNILFLAAFLCVLPLISSDSVIGEIHIQEDGTPLFYLESEQAINESGIFLEKGEILTYSNNYLDSQEGIWEFSLDLGEYEIILIDLYLPNNLQSIISTEGIEGVVNFDKKMIHLIRKNEKLSFKVKYQTEVKKKNYLSFFLGFILIVLVVVILLFLRKKKERKMKGIFPFVNKNEELIINKLMKKEMRQKELRELLKIPKASFTRYILNLEKKRILYRVGEGKNKILKLR